MKGKNKYGEIKRYKHIFISTRGGEEKMNKVIARFNKNSSEEIKASLTEYGGKKLADIRVWVKNGEDGAEIPTRKGISITRNLLPELREAVGKLEKEAQL